MGPVRQNLIQRTAMSVRMSVHCTVHTLLRTILHRTDLIIFPLTLQTITIAGIAPMMSIGGKGCPALAHFQSVPLAVVLDSRETFDTAKYR